MGVWGRVAPVHGKLKNPGRPSFAADTNESCGSKVLGKRRVFCRRWFLVAALQGEAANSEKKAESLCSFGSLHSFESEEGAVRAAGRRRRKKSCSKDVTQSVLYQSVLPSNLKIAERLAQKEWKSWNGKYSANRLLQLHNSFQNTQAANGVSHKHNNRLILQLQQKQRRKYLINRPVILESITRNLCA